MKRNGYIDIIKFLFAIMVAEFHFGSGIFPGGRIAVEGFFMITGFLTMKTAMKNCENGEIGKQTIAFMARKYKSLAFTLALSAIAAFVLLAVTKKYSPETVQNQLPLLIFEFFPLKTVGFRGTYTVGISWYLSSMFISLAILYPLCKRFRSNFTLTVCPLIVFLGYGLLSAKYGSLAVSSTFFEDSLLYAAGLRALAGCAAGCILFEVSQKIGSIRFTRFARIMFTLTEALLFTLILYFMHHRPKSAADYIVIFLIFGLLVIGINRLSYTSVLWNPKWTKPLGTASMLIVLNHYNWAVWIRSAAKEQPITTQFLIYAGAVAATCIAVYLLSKLLDFLCGKIFSKKLWIKDSPSAEKGEKQ